jgi:hypothetical protein
MTKTQPWTKSLMAYRAMNKRNKNPSSLSTMKLSGSSMMKTNKEKNKKSTPCWLIEIVLTPHPRMRTQKKIRMV